MFGPEFAFFKTGRLRGSVVPNGTMLMVNSECSRYGKGYLISAISLKFEEPHATAAHPFPTSAPPQGKARAQVSRRWAGSVTSQPDQRETECVGLGEACGGCPLPAWGEPAFHRREFGAQSLPVWSEINTGSPRPTFQGHRMAHFLCLFVILIAVL